MKKVEVDSKKQLKKKGEEKKKKKKNIRKTKKNESIKSFVVLFYLILGNTRFGMCTFCDVPFSFRYTFWEVGTRSETHNISLARIGPLVYWFADSIVWVPRDRSIVRSEYSELSGTGPSCL